MTALPGSQLSERLRDAGEGSGGFSSRGGVAGELVFEHEHDVLRGGVFGGLLQLVVDGGAVGLDIVDAPEVETADLIRFELFGEGDRAFEDFILMLEADLVGAVHVFLCAVLGDGRAGPVHLVERAADVGDLKTVLGEDLLRLGDLRVRDDLQVLAPDLAQFDPVKTEVLRDDVAGVIEVLGDLVGDDADLELRVRGECPQGQQKRCGCASRAADELPSG